MLPLTRMPANGSRRNALAVARIYQSCFRRSGHNAYKKTLEHLKTDGAKRVPLTVKYTWTGRAVYCLFRWKQLQTTLLGGYVLRGEACLSQYHWQLKQQTNAGGAVLNNPLSDCMMAVSTVIFFISRAAVDSPWPTNSIIVIDNIIFHKYPDIKALTEATGPAVFWFSPYSPDLNPIEQTWSWIKLRCKEWRLNCTDKLFFYFYVSGGDF